MGGRYDVAIIGGGHNGLVAAAYLTRHSLKPVVLEARDVIGGVTGIPGRNVVRQILRDRRADRWRRRRP